jgi:hypothetical protein
MDPIHGRRRRDRVGHGNRSARRWFLWCPIRPAYAGREKVPARDGGARTGSAPVGRCRRRRRSTGHVAGAHSSSTHRQGHDLEPEPRRYGLYRSTVRRVYASHHAWGGLANRLKFAARGDYLAPSSASNSSSRTQASSSRPSRRRNAFTAGSQEIRPSAQAACPRMSGSSSVSA